MGVSTTISRFIADIVLVTDQGQELTVIDKLAVSIVVHAALDVFLSVSVLQRISVTVPMCSRGCVVFVFVCLYQEISCVCIHVTTYFLPFRCRFTPPCTRLIPFVCVCEYACVRIWVSLCVPLGVSAHACGFRCACVWMSLCICVGVAV